MDWHGEFSPGRIFFLCPAASSHAAWLNSMPCVTDRSPSAGEREGLRTPSFIIQGLLGAQTAFFSKRPIPVPSPRLLTGRSVFFRTLENLPPSKGMHSSPLVLGNPPPGNTPTSMLGPWRFRQKKSKFSLHVDNFRPLLGVSSCGRQKIIGNLQVSHFCLQHDFKRSFQNFYARSG